MSTAAIEIALEPADNERLANLCGQFDENLRLLERRTGVEIGNRGNQFKLVGEHDVLVVTERVIRQLYSLTGTRSITGADVHLELRNADMSGEEEFDDSLGSIRTRRTMVKARGVNQRKYLDAIREFDISFGIGPAGTGKTYLAVASAVAALDSDSVRRICLVRPAVEAGERLGFLPGDMSQKIDPYLRPLYDALYEMLGFERVAKLIERNIIEVAPLAFMRGRTLDHAFVILDEAQNATLTQMKMFLTRMGRNAKFVITGDATQVDLPDRQPSGLLPTVNMLRQVEGVAVVELDEKDVIRHELVTKVLKAFRELEERNNENRK